MSVIKKSGRFAAMEVMPELEEVVNAVFLKMPDLSFEALECRHTALNSAEFIYSVEVYAGNQRVGAISYERKYVQSQGMNINTYAISSPRVQKRRGRNKDTRYAKEIKSIVNLAKQLLVPGSKDSIAEMMIMAFKQQFNSIVYTGSRDYKAYADKYGSESFAYLVDLIQGGSPTMPPAVMVEVRSEKFKTAHDTYRIIRSLQNAFYNNDGVVMKIERDETISVAELVNTCMAIEAKSTYDLPKNYQEKLTILKVMDKNTPIEHVGVKVETEVNDQACTLYYILGGDTYITH